MRKIVFNVVIGFFSAVILLLSAIFLVIEGRLLFSGDWLVYDNVALGFFKYFFRVLIALAAGTYAVFEFINMKKNSKTIKIFLFIANVVLILMCTILGFTATNMEGEIALIIALLAFIAKLTSFIFLKENFKIDKKENI